MNYQPNNKDMEERILKILTANNYPLGEDSDDVQCAKEITALIQSEYYEKEFTKWMCEVRYPFLQTQNGWKRADMGNVIYTLDEIYKFWLKEVKNK